MKKIVLLCFISIAAGFLFAENIHIEKITDALKQSGLYAFSKEAAQKEQKPFLNISSMPKEKFIKQFKTPWTRKELFPDPNNITYADVIKTFKDGVNADSLPSWTYDNYSWHKGKNLEYSVIYSMNIYYPITGPGFYSIKIFDTDCVYMISLSENRVIDEPDEDFDALKDFFEYRKGQKANANKGLEQTQGYYCNEEAAAKFYAKLRRKDGDLPKCVQRFQEAQEFIENLLDNYQAQ